ncbi:DnaJ domain-containing protein [Pararhodospirillum photometricum]|nr:DnaJ domain-containing protein [Pararhodospirillum photometricum]
MATPIADPKGYYRVLGVTPGASAAVIKRAYRRKAMLLHPDRNPSPNAVAEFQLLHDAYQTLLDPGGREAYHRGAARSQAPRPTAQAESLPAFHSCRVCGTVTAQPRYLILEKVTARGGRRVQHESISGVFCRRCADRTALFAALHCWVRGWWAVPSGPFHTLIALWINLKGGMRPARENALLLLEQARAFLARGQREIAHELAAHARRLAPTERERTAADRLMNALAGDAPTQRLVDVWRRPGVGFWLQLVLPLCFFLLLSLVGWPWLRDLMPGATPGTLRPRPAVSGVILVDPATVAPSGRVYAVAVPTTVVRTGPGEAFETVAVLQRNTFVMFVDTAGAWARVVTAQGVLGYVWLDDMRAVPGVPEPAQP